MAYKTFVQGNQLNASELNTYLMRQTVMVFQSTSDAATSLGTLSDGMTIFSNVDKTLYTYRLASDTWMPIVVVNNWLTYTPTLSNLTLGNGTILATYTQIGKTVHVRIRFTLGSTSAVTGSASFSLPVAPNGFAYGSGVLNTGVNQAAISVISGTNVAINAIDTATAYGTMRSTTATLPGTWATGHTMSLSITYEAI